MIQLSVNYSSGLAELLQAGAAPIQAIEFGPSFRPEQITAIRRKIPNLPFHFHHGNLIARLKWEPGMYDSLRAYLDCTHSPWISAHISMLPPGHVFFARYLGIYLREEPAETATRLFTEQVAWLQERVSVPLILENMPSLSARRHAYEVDPLYIRRILDQTGAGFLLDLGHARVAASMLGRDVCAYLQELPLERTVQIHASGPRLRDGVRDGVRKGVLTDAHEPMQEEDYRLLAWALERTNPQVVTLEYFKEKGRLAEQLGRLAEMITGSRNGAPGTGGSVMVR